jgi:hypothetical protein
MQASLFKPVHFDYVPVDWFAVLCDLHRRGFSNRAIADQLGLNASTVCAWYNQDSCPKHSAGEALLMLWRTVTGLCEVPRSRCIT